MRKRDLSQQRQQLLNLMQEMRYGRIENLTIRMAEPVFDQSMRVIREVLLGKNANDKTRMPGGDFELKSQIMEMFECFERLQDGVIPLLRVQDGLPFQLQLEEHVTV